MRKQYINAKLFNREETSFITNDGFFESFGIIDNELEKIDVRNKLVLPGFFDSHLHLVGLGYNKSLFDLNGLDVRQIVKLMKECNKDFIIGRGWHQNSFTNSLTRDDLDKVSIDKPVIAIRVCGHVLVANSKAIQLSGIKTDYYPGGTINLETGEFTEDALEVIYNLIPKPTVESIKEMILLSQEDLLANGITTVGTDDFSMINIEYEDVIKAYTELIDENKLKIRIIQQVNLPKVDDFKDFLSKGYANRIYSSHFKMGPLKLLLDGSLGGMTAFMNNPYEGTDNVGVHTFSQDELNHMIKLAQDNGMDFAIHAIGDGAVDMILNAPKKKSRSGIIHAQFLNQSQIDECLKQSLTIYAQPIFLNSDIPIIEKLVGDRYKESYLFKSMYDKGLSVSFSTDAPIESINPFENIFVAIKRTQLTDNKPFLIDEAFSFEETIKCYTEECHWQVYEKNGKLDIDYPADFIVVDLKKDIKSSKVLSTYVAGDCVHMSNRG